MCCIYKPVGRFCNVGQLNINVRISARETFAAMPPYHDCHTHFNCRARTIYMRYVVW